LTISAADVETGDFVEFTQDNTNFYDMAQAALSSSSIPILFPPQDFKGHLLMDGGTIWDVNISSAVKQCNDMGATNEEITIDIAVCLNKFTHGGPVVNSI
jgi:predicted acylesterase/phospholipase RssA